MCDAEFLLPQHKTASIVLIAGFLLFALLFGQSRLIPVMVGSSANGNQGGS
jgi:branched-subunit amino acid permease